MEDQLTPRLSEQVRGTAQEPHICVATLRVTSVLRVTKYEGVIISFLPHAKLQ